MYACKVLVALASSNIRDTTRGSKISERRVEFQRCQTSNFFKSASKRRTILLRVPSRISSIFIPRDARQIYAAHATVFHERSRQNLVCNNTFTTQLHDVSNARFSSYGTMRHANDSSMGSRINLSTGLYFLPIWLCLYYLSSFQTEAVFLAVYCHVAHWQ